MFFSCDGSQECLEHGRCGTSGYRAGDGPTRCYPRDEADCLQSQICAREGRCAYDPGVSLECIVPRTPAPSHGRGPCATEIVCREIGMCGVYEGTCAATDEESCANSLGCVLHGRCTLLPQLKMCGAASDDDCASSLECLAFGRCKRFELSSLGIGIGIGCVAPGEKPGPYNDIQCTRHPECSTEGRCLRNPEGNCRTPEEEGVPGERLRRAWEGFTR